MQVLKKAAFLACFWVYTVQTVSPVFQAIVHTIVLTNAKVTVYDWLYISSSTDCKPGEPSECDFTTQTIMWQEETVPRK